MDILNEWGALFLSIFSIIIVFVYNTLKPSKTNNPPPSPPKLPILGNLHQLLLKPRHEALWQLSKKYGPIMQLHMGSEKFLVISSPAMAKEILKTQDHIFCSRASSRATQQLTYNFKDVVFSPHSSHWRDMRKILVSEFLGPKRAKLSNHALVKEMEDIIHSLSLQPPNTVVNLSDMFFDIIKQIVCKVAFGKNYMQQPVKGPSLAVMLEETVELLSGSVGDSFPFFGYFIDQFIGWNRRLKVGFQNFDDYIDTIVNHHLKDNVGEISEEDKDLVHSLLEMVTSEENASGYRPTNTDLKAILMDLIIGGIDTTALTLTWTMSEIVRDSRVMQKLQREIRNCAGGIQGVEQMDTTKMTYLKMVVKESLRLHTPAPYLIPRASLSHTQIGGYDVFPGTFVLINAWGIARDPSTWGENAAEFYPERFENIDGEFGRNRFEMLPFGGGRRSCPAKNISPTNVEFVIANLLYWFDWELPSGMKSEDMNMESCGTLSLRKKAPLCLVPTKHDK